METVLPLWEFAYTKGCVNQCAKPCCREKPRRHITKCIGCKRHLHVFVFCGTCRDLFDYVTVNMSVQLCGGWKCFYICTNCLTRLGCVSCTSRNIYEGGNPGLDRIWKHGQEFDYIHIALRGTMQFPPAEWTFRKAIR